MSGLKRTNARNRSLSIKSEWQWVIDFADEMIESKKIESFSEFVLNILALYLSQQMSKAHVIYVNMTPPQWITTSNL